MRRLMILGLALAFAPAAIGEESDARALAQGILDKGATLLESRDAAAMAATYTDDARVVIVLKDGESGRFKDLEKQGRGEIEELYRGLYNDDRPINARNQVDFARLVSPNLLVIQGVLTLDAAGSRRFAFVQERRKDGERWLIASLRVYAID